MKTTWTDKKVLIIVLLVLVLGLFFGSMIGSYTAIKTVVRVATRFIDLDEALMEDALTRYSPYILREYPSKLNLT